MKFTVTFSPDNEREYAWDPADSCEWFEPRAMHAGVLAIYRCWHPQGGDYGEQLIEAYAPGQWLKVRRE